MKQIHVAFDRYSKNPVAAFTSSSYASLCINTIGDSRLDLETVPIMDIDIQPHEEIDEDSLETYSTEGEEALDDGSY